MSFKQRETRLNDRTEFIIDEDHNSYYRGKLRIGRKWMQQMIDRFQCDFGILRPFVSYLIKVAYLNGGSQNRFTTPVLESKN